MKILLLLLNTNNEYFNKYCLDRDLITNTLKIDNNVQILNTYFNTFLQYDYLVLLDEHYSLNREFKLIEYIQILNKNHYQQIFFTSNTHTKSIKIQNIFEPVIQAIDFHTKKHLESSLTILKDSLKLNPPKWLSPSGINDTGIDYFNYIDNNEVNRYYFDLKPSIINTSIFNTLKNQPLTTLYYDRTFSKLYSDYFKSCYFKNICSKNSKHIEPGDPNDMTIVTGFINIPNKEKSVKTYCKKKHKYNYIEKSIATLKIKQKMIIYIPENLYNHVYEIRNSIHCMDKTKIIIITDEFLYMKDYVDKIGENCKKNNEIYQNPYYICAVSTRYNLMRDAIKNNVFNTNYFTWVDFGAIHCIDLDNNTTFSYNKKKCRISWIARYNKNLKQFVYNHFVLGGGIFGGHKSIVNKVCDLHDEIFKNNMDIGYNCNDDKTLWFIFEKYPELFDTYFTGYKYIAYRY